MNEIKCTYTSRNIAFIIPTKDRPGKIKNVLDSLMRQTVSCGRIIVVNGGQSVKDVVMPFFDILPIEYYECNPSGQIRQRNMGIALIDKRTPLVGFLDDDIVLEPQALESIISFWNKCAPETAGVSFNIINTPLGRCSWLELILGLNAPQKGRVLRSGMTTSNCQVATDLCSQWLCGGATIWKKNILDMFPHKEISSRWAIGEDIIFSYPIGKKFPLYVCAASRVSHEHTMDYVSRMKYRFHGRTQTLWLFYFVESNRDLSRLLFFWTLFVRIFAKCVMGVIMFKIDYFEFAVGQLEGAVIGLWSLISGKDISTILSESKNAK